MDNPVTDPPNQALVNIKYQFQAHSLILIIYSQYGDEQKFRERDREKAEKGNTWLIGTFFLYNDDLSFVQ